MAENSRKNVVQLAPKNISLPTHQADRIDNSTSHNLILLTSAKIGLNPSTHKAFTTQVQQQGLSITQECPTYNQSTKPSPLEAPPPISPRMKSLKTTSTLSSQVKCDYPNLFPQGLQNQNSIPSPRNKLATYPLPHITTFNPPSSPQPQPNALKRKVARPELDQFSKRLRKVVEGPELVYFNPATMSFIPESRLEFWRKGEN